MKLLVGHRACGILFRYVKHVGGKWLLPANVCPVVPFTLIEAEVPFEFVDIDKNTLCIKESDVLMKMHNDETIKGVIYVHTYGCERNISNFIGTLRESGRNIKIIDDRCLCRPDLKSPISEANMLLYSTGYAKYVDLGEGGFAWLQDDESVYEEDVPYLGDTIEDYYKYLQAANKQCLLEEIPEHWINAGILSREDAIQNYFCDIQNSLPVIDRHKNVINAVYGDITSSITLGANMNNWRYSIFVNNKDELLSKIFGAGLFASSHYCPSSRLFTTEYYPNAEWLYRHIINLFNDQHVSIEQARRVVNVLAEDSL